MTENVRKGWMTSINLIVMCNVVIITVRLVIRHMVQSTNIQKNFSKPLQIPGSSRIILKTLEGSINLLKILETS